MTDNNSSGTPPWKYQYIFASVLLALFVVLVAVMLKNAKTSDSTWKNMIYVFSSAEALVFTAVGWVFGREVQRTQLEAAKNSVDDAKKDSAESAAESKEAQKKASDQEKKVAALHAAVDVAMAAQARAPVQRGAGDIALGDEPEVDASTSGALGALGALVERQRAEG